MTRTVPTRTVPTRPDPHSYRDNTQPTMKHIEVEIEPDFDQRIIYGVVEIVFDRGGTVDLDTRDLTITRVVNADFQSLPFELAEPDPLLGTRLTFVVPDDEPVVIIEYKTAPTASGLQWLTPEQTAGKRHPFLYSQGECIHTRSYIPCQDTPGVRVTFQGRIIVPSELRGLMAATFVERRKDGDGVSDTWKMTKPIPPYLIAFAVGDVVSHALTPRIRVWAERPVIEAAAREFEALSTIMDKAEELFGPYPWDRYDLLIMPPSFPFGGMENQGLTFLSPSVLAGDGSMLSVVAHELAHSWTGNLVTNATWDHFWLNEGWTTWAEGRIGELAFGVSVADLNRAIMGTDLRRDIERFMKTGRPDLTRLAWNLGGTDPDDAFSRVPYSKGAQFLTALETHVGRDAFDAFTMHYIQEFAFQSITTEEFLHFLEAHLPGAFAAIDGDTWIHGTGMPSTAVPISSPLIDEVTQFAVQGQLPSLAQAADWHALQWAIYLERLPRTIMHDRIHDLQRLLHLEEHGNMDIRFNLALLYAEAGYYDGLQFVESVLAGTGRTRYLLPIYKALAQKGGVFGEFARRVFAEQSASYHAIAQKGVERTFVEAAT